MNNLFEQKPGDEKEEQVDNLESDEALEEVNDHDIEDQVVKAQNMSFTSFKHIKSKLTTLHLLRLPQAEYHIQNLSLHLHIWEALVPKTGSHIGTKRAGDWAGDGGTGATCPSSPAWAH